MNSLKLSLCGETHFPLTYFGKDYIKKETTGNDYLTLYGALACFCANNAETLTDYGFTMSDVIGCAAMQDSELYLNNFKGYQISDRLNLCTLYLNEYNKIIWSVYDNKLDRFIDFV